MTPDVGSLRAILIDELRQTMDGDYYLSKDAGDAIVRILQEPVAEPITRKDIEQAQALMENHGYRPSGLLPSPEAQIDVDDLRSTPEYRALPWPARDKFLDMLVARLAAATPESRT